MRSFEEIRSEVERRSGLVLDHDGGESGLAFQLPSGVRVIASWGGGWDHVSVSRAKYIPTYMDMETVREVCFKPDETVMQLSVARGDHINVHPNCLHMWRPQDQEIPMPPREFV